MSQSASVVPLPRPPQSSAFQVGIENSRERPRSRVRGRLPEPRTNFATGSRLAARPFLQPVSSPRAMAVTAVGAGPNVERLAGWHTATGTWWNFVGVGLADSAPDSLVET